MKNTKAGFTFGAFVSIVVILLIAIGVFLFVNTTNGQATIINSANKQLLREYNDWKMKEENISREITVMEAKQLAKEANIIIPNGYGIDVVDGKPQLITTLKTIKVGIFAKENSTVYGDIPWYNNPVVPKGFKAVDSEIVWVNDNSYNQGLVIEDEYGNQFVWVPVDGTTVQLQTTGWEKNEKVALNNMYIELSSKLYENEQMQYSNLLSSVNKYGGFYIARFEAGSEEATANWIGRSDKNIVETIGFRKNMIVYNMVEFAENINTLGTKGAVYLSQNMYNDEKYGVTSTLTYGCQWDALLMWIKSGNFNVTSSKLWGNYKDATINSISSETKYGIGSKSATYLWLTNATKSSGKAWLMTTGSAESLKTKNIYDIAGNASEWTMESTTGNQRIIRGGSFSDNSSSASASTRTRASVTDTSSNISFRVCLFVNI